MVIDEWAESRPYWDTTVHPARSMGEIQEILEDFDVQDMMNTTGRINGKLAWIIRFRWHNETYRFVFTPLACQHPLQYLTRSGKSRNHEEQARYQMGRIAVWFVKAILTAAEAQPAALFGFKELPEVVHREGTMPVTAAEVDVTKLIGEGSHIFPELPIPEGEITDV